MTETTGKWRLEGLDTFDNESYALPGEHDTEEEAITAARARLQHLEETQPTAESGGQEEHGIQDEVWIVRPNGTQYRFTG